MSDESVAYVILQGSYEQQGVSAVALDRVAAEREAQRIHEEMDPPRRHRWKAPALLSGYASCAEAPPIGDYDDCEVAIQEVRLVP